MLASSCVAGRPEEYWHPETKAARGEPLWADDWKSGSFQEVFPRILSYGTTPNGVFGSKLMFHRLAMLSEGLRTMDPGGDPQVAEQLESAFPNLRYIWVTRRDKVRQAVSLFRARQSDNWIQKDRVAARTEKLEFNYQLIHSSLQHIIRTESDWAQYFSTSGIVPFTVVYEDLVQDLDGTVRRALQFLGIELAPAFVFPTPRVHKQADDVSEEWVRRYYEMERTTRIRSLAVGLPSILMNPRLRRAYVTSRVRAKLRVGS